MIHSNHLSIKLILLQLHYKPEYEPFLDVSIISRTRMYSIKSVTLLVAGLFTNTSLELATAAINWCALETVDISVAYCNF